MREHGTRPCYQGGCRCAPCKAANADYSRAVRSGAPRPKTPKQPPLELEHGTRGCYVHEGCRCAPCAEANRDYQRRYMKLRRAGVAPTDPQIEAALAGASINPKGKALRRR